MASEKTPSEQPAPSWTFMTNHAHVLVCIARNNQARLRDVATAVGVTERTAQRIVLELVDAGYLTLEKSGRRNYYEINSKLPLRHKAVRNTSVGEFLSLFTTNGDGPT